MPLIVAGHAGFCYGVRRAMDSAEKAAEAGGCVTLGPLIHNMAAVRELAAKGAPPVSSPYEVPEGGVCVIRSHGEPPDVYDILAKRNVTVIDATCPNVARIHKLVSEAAAAGRRVLLIGKKAHPEVTATLGWAGAGAEVIETAEDAMDTELTDDALIVCQTTFGIGTFREITEILKKRIPGCTVCDTICRETYKRQHEAEEIARRADRMIVVGGADSSNTKELFKICSRFCPCSMLVESAKEIDAAAFKAGDLIGIAAGASTPEATFKEVVAHMNDIENKEQITENTEISEFEAGLDQTLRKIRPGETITGKVVLITEDEVCVDISYKADGIVKKSDLSSTDVNVGDEIEVEVVKVNDGEGNVILSQRNIVNKKAWDAIVAANEAGEFVEGIGKEAVKGGLIAQINGIRAFIPASQLSLRYVEKIDEYVGKPMQLKIIEMDDKKKRVVASHKAYLAVEEAEKKKAIWSNLEVGSVVKGTVRRLTDFGAFVDIGGVDGLVHVTDLSWGRVRHPSDVVAVGDEIDVKITNVDIERQRISLSYKQTQPRPWDVAGEKYAVGSIVEGKAVRLTTFGAFVELEPGLDGLVHISQCALTRIEKVEDAVKVGDIVRVKVLDVNSESKRISLSIRAALEQDALDTVPEEIEELPVDEPVQE